MVEGASSPTPVFWEGDSGEPPPYLGTFCKGAVGWGTSRDLASPPQ